MHFSQGSCGTHEYMLHYACWEISHRAEFTDVSAFTAQSAELEGAKGHVASSAVYSVLLSNGNHPMTSLLLIHHKRKIC